MQTPEQARLTEELRRKMAALQAEGRPVPVPNLAKLGLTNGHDRMEAAGSGGTAELLRAAAAPFACQA